MLGVDCQVHATPPLDLTIQREQLGGLFSLICPVFPLSEEANEILTLFVAEVLFALLCSDAVASVARQSASIPRKRLKRKVPLD